MMETISSKGNQHPHFTTGERTRTFIFLSILMCDKWWITWVRLVYTVLIRCWDNIHIHLALFACWCPVVLVHVRSPLVDPPSDHPHTQTLWRASKGHDATICRCHLNMSASRTISTARAWFDNWWTFTCSCDTNMETNLSLNNLDKSLNVILCFLSWRQSRREFSSKQNRTYEWHLDVQGNAWGSIEVFGAGVEPTTKSFQIMFSNPSINTARQSTFSETQMHDLFNEIFVRNACLVAYLRRWCSG